MKDIELLALVEPPVLSKPRRGKKEQAARIAPRSSLPFVVVVPPSKDNSQPRDSPCDSTVVPSQSVKCLANTQVQSTPEALGEVLHSDSDHN